MAKIFTLLKTMDRHFELSDFLISKGHIHDQSWEHPPILPFGSCSLMEKYIKEGGVDLPDICIFDFNLRSDITGEGALSCIQSMSIFNLSMPVIYLLGKGESIKLNTATKYIYWEQNDFLDDKTKENLVLVIDEILRPKTGFFDEVIASI